MEIDACDSTSNRWIKGDTAKTGKENEACENIDIKCAIDQRVDGGKTNYATSRKPVRELIILHNMDENGNHFTTLITTN